MSTGKWRERDSPPDYQPTNPLRRLAELEEEEAAHHSSLAQLHGLKSQLYRTLATQQERHTARGGEPRAA